MQMLVDEQQLNRKKKSLGTIHYESDSQNHVIKHKVDEEEDEELDVSSYSADSNLHSKMPTPISARPAGNYAIDQEDTILMDGANKNNFFASNQDIQKSARRSLEAIES